MLAGFKGGRSPPLNPARGARGALPLALPTILLILHHKVTELLSLAIDLYILLCDMLVYT